MPNNNGKLLFSDQLKIFLALSVACGKPCEKVFW